MAEGTVVVAESRDALDAMLWLEALQQAGIRASTFEQGLGGAYGGAWGGPWTRHCVVVARTDLARARSIIADLGGASRLSPYDDPQESRERAHFAAITVAGAVLLIIAALAVARMVGA